MEVVVEPCEGIFGEVEIPGDKSISHRAVMLAALADSPTYITGFLPGLDALASVEAIKKIGIHVEHLDPSVLLVHGNGISQFTQLLAQPSSSKNQEALNLDFHNAGTGIRLFSGLIASATRSILLTGDKSLCSRPMKRIIGPLKQMGVDIMGSVQGDGQEETAPLYLNFTTPKKLTAINFVLPQASAQVKSCLLLAGLFVEGETTLTEPIQTRDHTEKMLKEFGLNVNKKKQDIYIQGGAKNQKIGVNNSEYHIVKDFSSAAFFIVGALLAKRSEIIFKKIGVNPTRTGLLSVLLKMGADIQLCNQQIIHNEPIADILVTNKNRLCGTYISHQTLVSMIDEFPIFLLAALHAEGPTVIEGIEELAYKESNRVETMVKGLRQLGAKFEVMTDQNKMVVYPLTQSKACSFVLDGAKDHRVAMSLFMASLLGKGEIRLRSIENIETSFPNFFNEARKVGFSFKIITNQGGA